MLFGIDGVELVVIIVLAVVIFGPEKLPQFSRKAARIFVYLRDVANNAKQTISTELGPDYADIQLKDLNPKTFIAKQLRDEVALIDETKRELAATAATLKTSAKELEASAKEIEASVKADAPAVETPPTPFDPEAT